MRSSSSPRGWCGAHDRLARARAGRRRSAPSPGSSSTAPSRTGSAARSRSGRSPSTSPGAFALGVLSGNFVVGTGFVGAYTTFSTWMLETQRLAEDGRSAAALANVFGSLALGLGAAALGAAL